MGGGGGGGGEGCIHMYTYIYIYKRITYPILSWTLTGWGLFPWESLSANAATGLPATSPPLPAQSVTLMFLCAITSVNVLPCILPLYSHIRRQLLRLSVCGSVSLSRLVLSTFDVCCCYCFFPFLNYLALLGVLRLLELLNVLS
jgi:hypothetical protein